jgi:hypothetical protein
MAQNVYAGSVGRSGIDFLCVDRDVASAIKAADLHGYVRDPNGAAVKGATVTARNPRPMSLARQSPMTTVPTAHQPAPAIKVTAEATGFSKGRIASATHGGSGAELTPLAIGDIGAVVNIAAQDVGLIEKTSNTVANTIEQTHQRSADQ